MTGGLLPRDNRLGHRSLAPVYNDTMRFLVLCLLIIFTVGCTKSRSAAPATTQSTASTAPSASEDLATQIKQMHQLETEIEEKLLAVPEEDQALYRTFLQKPDTGLIKLLPRGKYDNVLLVRGGCSYYAFARRVWEYNYGSDIELTDKNTLMCGFAGSDHGAFLNVGDVPIEDVAQATEKPPAWAQGPVASEWHRMWQTEAPDMRRDSFEREVAAHKEEFDRLVAEAERNPRAATQQQPRLKQSSFLLGEPVVVGNSYLLRSEITRSSDLVVGFRIIRKMDDGSIVLVYKILKTFTPDTRRNLPARR